MTVANNYFHKRKTNKQTKKKKKTERASRAAKTVFTLQERGLNTFEMTCYEISASALLVLHLSLIDHDLLTH